MLRARSRATGNALAVILCYSMIEIVNVPMLNFGEAVDASSITKKSL